MNSALAGAIGGIVATYAMTVAMAKMKKRLPAEQRAALPPRRITEGALRPVQEILPPERHEEAWRDLSLTSHFAFGAMAGAAWGALHPKSSVSNGILYGLGVWAGSYMGWVPSFGLMPPATRQPLQRNLLMIAAHVVWGASLHAAARHIRLSDPVVADERPAPRRRREKAESTPAWPTLPGKPGIHEGFGAAF
jgi:uncharacterized membrane protein YagU involved in acid resistance